MRTIKRIHDILNLFTPDTPLLSVLEVAHKLRLNRGTVNSTMTSMLALNILTKSEENKKYGLGIKVFEWGQVFLSSTDLKQIALIYMRELSNNIGEEINLHEIRNNMRYTLEYIESPQPVRHIVETEERNGVLYAGAPGKMLLAYLPPNELKEYLNKTELIRFTKNTITDKDTLRKELKMIRENEFAVSKGEQLDSLWAVSTPLKNSKGEVIAAISVISLINHHSAAREKRYVSLLKETAHKISSYMG